MRGGLLHVRQDAWAVQRDGLLVGTCDGTVNGVCRVGLCPGGRLVCPAHVRRPLHGGRGFGVHGVHFLAQANSVQHSTRSTRSLVCRLHRPCWTCPHCHCSHRLHPRCCPRGPRHAQGSGEKPLVTSCIFEMSRSDLTSQSTRHGSDVVLNKHVVVFEDGAVLVGVVSKEPLCVGNRGRTPMTSLLRRGWTTSSLSGQARVS